MRTGLLLILAAVIASSCEARRSRDLSECPSDKCRCSTHEVASRLEVKVICNLRAQQGYVPVFNRFNSQISSLIVSRLGLQHLGNQTFDRLAYVRALYLNDNLLVRIEGHAFDGIAYGIEILDLSHNRIKDLTFLTSHNFVSLRELLLRDNQIQHIRPDSLSVLPALETLNFDDNQLSSDLSFLRHRSLKAINHLNLDSNKITRINTNDFTYLTNLRSLLLNHNQVSNLDFLADSAFKQLNGLSLSSNNISEVRTELLTGKNLLRWIDLSSNKLSEVNFLTSCSLRSLEEVYLSYNNIRVIPEAAFQATESLTIFTVSHNHIERLSACSLAKFYSYMEKFDISDNPFRCDCSLAWLHKSHNILTERHAFCQNLEFSKTDNFNSSRCGNDLECSSFNMCTSNRYSSSLLKEHTGGGTQLLPNDPDSNSAYFLVPGSSLLFINCLTMMMVL